MREEASQFPQLELAFLRLTTKCPNKCDICDIWKKPVCEPPPQQWLSVLRDLARSGCREVTLTGGEPLRYDGFEAVVDEATRLGLVVNVITSASGATDLVCGILERPAIKDVHLSIDSPSPEGHDAVRGTSGLYKAAIDLANRIGTRPNGRRLVANVVVSSRNIRELKWFVEQDLFHAVNFIPIKDRPMLNLATCNTSDRDTFEEIVRDNARKLYVLPIAGLRSATPRKEQTVHLFDHARHCPCAVAARTLFIDASGNAFPCNCLPYGTRMRQVGNVFETEFGEVWRSPLAAQFRREASAEKWVQCDTCDLANRLANEMMLTEI